MSVGGISNSSLLNQVYTSSTTDSADLVSSTTTGEDTTRLSTSDHAKISHGAKMMSQLASLAQSDPEKFKEVTQKISDELAAKAKNSSTDSNASALYSEMSEKFAQAAKSGSMDSLKPPTKPGGGMSMGGGNGFQMGSRPSSMPSDSDNPMASMDSIIQSALGSVEG